MKKIPLGVGLALAVLSLLTSSLRAQDTTAATEPKMNGYTVTLKISVNEKGETGEVDLVNSDDRSTGQVLDRLAVAMALKTKLPVREKDGHAIRYSVIVPYFFPIEDDEGAAANNQPKPRGRVDVSRQVNYPVEMKERDEVGGVILELVIDTQGNISRLTTLRASNKVFEEAALTGVKTWKFVPAKKDGQPVETRWRVAIVFETADKVPDIKWLIPPRPSLGTFRCFYDNSPRPDPAAQAPNAPAAPAAEAPAAPAPGK